MTAIIIPFPVRPSSDPDYDLCRQSVMEDHPEWDAAKVHRVALLAVHIERSGLLDKYFSEAARNTGVT
ncbi:hypothetical protein [Thermomonas sp.]|uniref:hypothetical protein n=1 Tax=Thermomonas sp. TaxID=1971895 RepID=UPI0035B19760